MEILMLRVVKRAERLMASVVVFVSAVALVAGPFVVTFDGQLFQMSETLMDVYDVPTRASARYPHQQNAI